MSSDSNSVVSPSYLHPRSGTFSIEKKSILGLPNCSLSLYNWPGFGTSFPRLRIFYSCLFHGTLQAKIRLYFSRLFLPSPKYMSPENVHTFATELRPLYIIHVSIGIEDVSMNHAQGSQRWFHSWIRGRYQAWVDVIPWARRTMRTKPSYPKRWISISLRSLEEHDTNWISFLSVYECKSPIY